MRGTPRMSQGEAEQSIDGRNTGPATVQFKLDPEKFVAVARIVPFAPGIPVAGEVGITFRPGVEALLTPFWPKKMAK